MQMTHNFSSLSIHHISIPTSVIYKMLYNRSLLGWLLIFSLSTLLKLNFFLLDLNNNSLKYRTALLPQPTPLATLIFIFDVHLTLSDQITALFKSCYYHIRELRCIRSYTDFKTTSTIATSIVHSKLDYCNYLYHNLPNCQLNRLQQTRNSLAHAVVKAPINPLISLPFSNLSTGQRTRRI